MGTGGYHSGKQPDDLPVEVGGVGTSGRQEQHKDINDQPFTAVEADNNSKADGDQSTWSLPTFADGQDVRKTYKSPGSN